MFNNQFDPPPSAFSLRHAGVFLFYARIADTLNGEVTLSVKSFLSRGENGVSSQ